MPIVFSGIFGLGNIFVFAGVFTFLVECVSLAPVGVHSRCPSHLCSLDETIVLSSLMCCACSNMATIVLKLTRPRQYPLYAASALAANSFARSSFAAAFPLFGVQMYESESALPRL